MPPELLVVGHVVQDLPSGEGDGEGWRPGGAAVYCSLLAQRLGLRTAVLTAAAPDLPVEEILPGIEVVRVPSPASTQIRNVYTDEGRVQYIPQRAEPIDAAALPEAWRDAEIVLLGPVVNEVDPAIVAAFRGALIGVAAQGYLRDIGPDGRVRPLSPERWQAAPLLQPSHVLTVSDEDLDPGEARRWLNEWSDRVRIVAFTRGERGAEVCHHGVWRHIDAFPAASLDPTGAGDIFATAFLVRYRETGDPWEAARFASCAASFIVEGAGQKATPDRAMIEARLARHPEIVAAD
jgi:sugar/nucleoside kinase (ribokinase family)